MDIEFINKNGNDKTGSAEYVAIKEPTRMSEIRRKHTW